jgi:hypothetical protein
MRLISIVNHHYVMPVNMPEHYEIFRSNMEDLGFTTKGEFPAGENTVEEYRSESHNNNVVTLIE